MLSLALTGGPPPGQLGYSEFMQAAAGLLPLLVIAAVLERRLIALPESGDPGRLRRIVDVCDAVLALALSILFIAGEYVALASLARGFVTKGDQHFVAVTIAIAAGVLLVPILAARGWAAAPPQWSAGDRLTLIGVMIIAGVGAAVALLEFAAP